MFDPENGAVLQNPYPYAFPTVVAVGGLAGFWINPLSVSPHVNTLWLASSTKLFVTVDAPEACENGIDAANESARIAIRAE